MAEALDLGALPKPRARLLQTVTLSGPLSGGAPGRTPGKSTGSATTAHTVGGAERRRMIDRASSQAAYRDPDGDRRAWPGSAGDASVLVASWSWQPSGPMDH